MKITLKQLLSPDISSDFVEAIESGEAFDLEGNTAYIIKGGSELKNEIDEWCTNTLEYEWASIGPVSYSITEKKICGWTFFNDNDALLFRLTWV